MKTKHKKEIREYLKETRLGDRLEFIFKWTGIKWLVKQLYPNCNCDNRKDILNGEYKIKRK
jgi:hypothetical protein